MEEEFRYYYECSEGGRWNISKLWYNVKERLLLEIDLDECFTLYIRQRKDIPMDYDDWDYKCRMQYWVLYLTDWQKIYDKFYGRTEDEFKEWIESCQRRIKVLNSN